MQEVYSAAVLTRHSKNRNNDGLVAIKIIDIDSVDYEEMTTKNLSETLKEINILQQLRDSKARPYVNIIEEARSVHNELWIVSEYASGGSVNTLMKPTMNLRDPGPGLPEKFIIPIARELALGLKYIHEAGVLHRDLKCNNILILEDGRVQLCDFGVSGQLEPESSKRSTIVGTPYWMAPELQNEWIKDAHPQSRIRPNDILYGYEVDIWAYGCTVYEMATGFPPFHRTVQWDLPDTGVPILEGERHSDALKQFVSFLLQSNPEDRPTPDDILGHPFLIDSTKMFPTVILVKLVEDYYKWEHEGGARASLFYAGGAQAPDPLAPEDDGEDDDWTFSTSDEFENRLSRAFPDPFSAIPGQSFTGINMPIDDEDRFAKLQATFREQQIKKGEERLNRLFDMDKSPYRYSGIDPTENGRPPSDLALRDFNPGAPNRETIIDLDFSVPTVADVPSIDLGEVPTLKANRMKSLLREMELEDEERDRFDDDQLTKRATRDWKFPTANEDTNRRTQDWKFPSAPEQPNRRTQDWKFPMAEEPMPPLNRQTRDFKFPAMPPPKPNRAKSAELPASD
jgi:protein-serine/threonine kinase